MNKPAIRYLVASLSGDVPADADRLDFPLECDPLGTPYRKYFRVILDFISKDNYALLLKVFNERYGTNADVCSISEIIIRTEKHGALFHPASVELMANGNSMKYCLNVAFTETGRDALKKEFALLKTLNREFNFSYIPGAYHAEEMHSAAFLLEEWFEGYHEFHLSRDDKGTQHVKLWEYGKGDRLLSSEECFELYRKAARILVLYYDLTGFRVIYPWHHAAGDFVVKISDDGQVDVRLTTVRGYESFMGTGCNEASPAIALFYFLLHLSIQMRLDKLDGVGEVAWADDLCVEATLAGFSRALEEKDGFGECCGTKQAFLELLKSFGKIDLGRTFIPILAQYEGTSDFTVVRERLSTHVDRLYLRLQNFP
jgi:hypothetical protein